MDHSPEVKVLMNNEYSSGRRLWKKVKSEEREASYSATEAEAELADAKHVASSVVTVSSLITLR